MRILVVLAVVALGCMGSVRDAPSKIAQAQEDAPVTEVRASIPDEKYVLMEFRRENLPAVALINSALAEFPGREAFGWHLSIIIDFEDLIENRMPSQQEREAVDPFCDLLENELKTPTARPNALFLGRVTWNGTRQLMFRVNNPEIANATLQKIITDKSSPREFDFRMENDDEWTFARWYLDAAVGE